jgi:hypothetical protein
MARAERGTDGAVSDELHEQVRHPGENNRAEINLASEEKIKEPSASLTSPKVSS